MPRKTKVREAKDDGKEKRGPKSPELQMIPDVKFRPNSAEESPVSSPTNTIFFGDGIVLGEIPSRSGEKYRVLDAGE